MSARLHRLRCQLLCQRRVAGRRGRVNVLEILLFDEKRCRIPARVPILLGRRAVQAVSAGLSREGDIQPYGMPHGGVKASRVDLKLGDLVGEGRERNPAASEIRRSVDGPLVLAKRERRKKARRSADLALCEVLSGSLVHHPGRHARHQDNVVGHDRQIHDFDRGGEIRW